MNAVLKPAGPEKSSDDSNPFAALKNLKLN